MKNLIKAELFKLSKSIHYRILILFSLGIAVVYSMQSTSLGYSMFHFKLADSLYQAIFTGAFIASFICSEFTNHTYGMSLFSGSRRRSIFLSKVVVFFIGLYTLLFADVILSTVIVSIVNGFGKELTAEIMKEILKMLFYFLIGDSAMGGYFVLIASLIRNTIGTIGVGVGVVHLLNIVVASFGDIDILKYTFVYQLSQLGGRLTSDRIFIEVSVITFVLTIILSAFIFEKRDLK